MAVPDWHPGQLAQLWLGGLVVITLLALPAIDFVANLPPFCIESADGRSTCDPTPDEIRTVRIAVALFIGALAAFATLLAVTWRWFGSRPK